MTTAKQLLAYSIEVNELQNAALAPISLGDIGASPTRSIAG
jgi:hypothetical protein